MLSKVTIKKHKLSSPLLALAILGLIVLSGCIPNTIKELGKAKELASVEVREYEGKKLSSINDFQENSIKGPQYIDKDKYRLKVTGLVKNPRTFSYEDIIEKHQLYKKVVTLNCVEGWSVTILWEGILLRDLLEEVLPKESGKVVIFKAFDGYSTSFPIEYFYNNDIIIAHKMNDTTMPAERGFPFELVAEDKWGYKWIKWITEIELSDNTEYEGYWESRGYSNEGDLDKSSLK